MDITISNHNHKYAKILKEIGFDGIDYRFLSTDNKGDVFTKDYEDYTLNAYNEFSKNGLYIAQTHLKYHGGQFPERDKDTYLYYEADYLDILIKEIELTSKINCPVAVMHPYFETSLENSREGNLTLIKKLLPSLEKYNVKLAIENIYGIDYADSHHSTIDDLLFYTNTLKSDYVGICVDTGHAIIRGQNPQEMLEKAGEKLFGVHLHTTVPNMDLHAIPYYSSYEEKINWEEIPKILKKINYKGTFNMELFSPKRISDKAKYHFYSLAYDVVKDIVK